MGESGSWSDGQAMLNKPLIQFSVDGWICVPSLLFTWGQTMVEVMKTMETSFKRSHTGTATLSAPTLQQATADPRLCQRLLDTQSQVWVSLLQGHCSFLLGSGVYKVLFVPSKTLFPQCCVPSFCIQINVNFYIWRDNYQFWLYDQCVFSFLFFCILVCEVVLDNTIKRVRSPDELRCKQV